MKSKRASVGVSGVIGFFLFTGLAQAVPGIVLQTVKNRASVQQVVLRTDIATPFARTHSGSPEKLIDLKRLEQTATIHLEKYGITVVTNEGAKDNSAVFSPHLIVQLHLFQVPINGSKNHVEGVLGLQLVEAAMLARTPTEYTAVYSWKSIDYPLVIPDDQMSRESMSSLAVTQLEKALAEFTLGMKKN